MFKYGFLVHDLSPNEITYVLIRAINHRIHKHLDEDFIIFYESAVVPCIPNVCATMQMAEAYNFDGLIISTGLPLAQRSLNFPTPKTVLYSWELEWMRVQPKVYNQLAGIYRNPALQLWARSPSHAKVIKEVWNNDVVVVDDWDFDQMREIYPTIISKPKIAI